MTQAYVPPHKLPAIADSGRMLRLSILVIAGVAALLGTGSYFAGRAVRNSEDGRVRVTVAAAAEPAAAPAIEEVVEETPAPEPVAPPNPFLGFNLELLDPRVEEAVLAAREVQADALEAARRAEAAARLARAGAIGAGIITYDGGDLYAGEILNGGRHGAGIYTWANPQEDYYAGEFVDDRIEGLGVKRWSDGATYYGDRRLETREGFGVFVDTQGGGYEGAWRNGAPDGYGVVWSPDGTVSAQGRWANNTLIEISVVPTPVPAPAPADAGPDGAAAPDVADAPAEPGSTTP